MFCDFSTSSGKLLWLCLVAFFLTWLPITSANAQNFGFGILCGSSGIGTPPPATGANSSSGTGSSGLSGNDNDDVSDLGKECNTTTHGPWASDGTNGRAREFNEGDSIVYVIYSGGGAAGSGTAFSVNVKSSGTGQTTTLSPGEYDISPNPVAITASSGASCPCSGYFTVTLKADADASEDKEQLIVTLSGTGAPAAERGIQVLDNGYEIAWAANNPPAAMTVVEGSSIVATITRTGSTHATSVNIVGSGTGITNDDYTINGNPPSTLTNTISFAENSSTATISVSIKGNADTDSETLTLALENADGRAAVPTNAWTITLAEPSAPVFSIKAVDPSTNEATTNSIVEVSEGSTVSFEIKPNSAPDENLTVPVRVKEMGTTLDADEYEALTPEMLTFASGQTDSMTVSINLNDDVNSESNETLIVELVGSGTSGGTGDYVVSMSDGEEVVIVTDDEYGVWFDNSLRDVTLTLTEGNTSANTRVLDIHLSRAQSSDISVNLVGSGVDPTDFTVSGGQNATVSGDGLVKSVEIAMGQTTAQVTVMVLDDTAPDEGDESLTLQLVPTNTSTSPAPYIDSIRGPDVVFLILEDNDPTVYVTVSVKNGMEVPRPSGDGDPVDFTISLVDGSGDVVTADADVYVNYAVDIGQNTTADFGGDPRIPDGMHTRFEPDVNNMGHKFPNPSGLVHFAKGGSSAMIRLVLEDDSDLEGDLPVILSLSLPAVDATNSGGEKIYNPNVKGLPLSATALVIDNDSAQVSISVSTTSITEGGSVTATVKLDKKAGLNDEDVTVIVPITYGGSASSESYRGAVSSVSLNFDDGPETFVIETTDDNLIEGNRDIVINLGTPDIARGSSGFVGRSATEASATVAITENDDISQIMVSVEAGEDAEEDGSPGSFIVSTTVRSTSSITVTYTHNGPRESYESLSGTVEILPMASEAVISVTAINDDADNGDGYDLTLDLTDATPGSIDSSASSATIKIVDKRAQPQDTGSVLSSQASSLNVGSAFSAVVNAGASGALSSLNSGTGVNDDAYGRLYVLSAREHPGDAVSWFTFGVADAKLDAELKGDGAFGYAMMGSELSKTDKSVTGLLFGVETSEWEFETESDVERTGVSIGVYNGRRFAGNRTYTASAILTASQNSFTAANPRTGTGEADSLRVLLTSRFRGGDRVYGNGATLSQYIDTLAAVERTEGFTFSDKRTQSEASRTNLARLSAGLEYTTAVMPEFGRLVIRGELGQTFGPKKLLLNDNKTKYTPNDNPTGSLTFGWLPDSAGDSSTRVELTIGEIGNDENEEIRLDGTFDRRF